MFLLDFGHTPFLPRNFDKNRISSIILNHNISFLNTTQQLTMLQLI